MSYLGSTSTDIRIDKIAANGQTWQYVYTTYSPTQYQLTEVRPPVTGMAWKYEYFSDVALRWRYSLKKVTHPYGAITEYQYGEHNFVLDQVFPLDLQVVIKKKTISGINVTGGVWDFVYDKVVINNNNMDRTA